MATNIEIKAKLPNFDNTLKLAEKLSDTPVKILRQEDTFFHTQHGRLKLRMIDPGQPSAVGQLIYYEREDTVGPKASHYLIARIPEPEPLKAVLAAAFGVRGIVRKTRRLYLVGNTRIHLDQVENLGDYLELEVVMQPEQSQEQGKQIADTLMAQLGLSEKDLVSGAYIDLLEQQSA